MTVGIDFGTSTSEIAYIGDGGKPVLIPNHLGEFITPSVVYIAEDGTPVVGAEAKEKSLLEPENTFIEVKRLFGQDKTLSARGRDFTPADIASMIIKYLVDCAQNHLGQAVDSAVITVPAYFNDNQRKDVMAAGKSAGLYVERIINEPTAASLDYGIEHMRDCNYLLVYDLGGGTLDVTVLELFEGVVDVKSSCGNNALGGKDFDQAIMDYIVDSIRQRDRVDISHDPRAMMRVKLAAEQCKIGLSASEEYEIELPFLYRRNNQPAGFAEKFTRAAFEDMIRDKICSTSQQIKTALFDAELSADDIDLTLLVGGSTRIPLVARFLGENFGFNPETLVDPDLAVVRGAAIQAGVLSGAISEDAIVLTDVCPYSLSTDVLAGDFFDRAIRCDILIRRNTTLPATVSKAYCTCHDYQQSVTISAFQGEGLYPEDNYLLNKFHLSGIPRARAGKEQILVTFSYDLNGILTVSAEIASTGKSAGVTVNTLETGKNLDLSKWKDAEAAKKYRKLINKADRLVKVHGEDKAEDLILAADELKKGIVLGWDEFVLEDSADGLQDEIDMLEEEL